MKSGEGRGANSTMNREARGINSSSIIQPIFLIRELIFDCAMQNYLT